MPRLDRTPVQAPQARRPRWELRSAPANAKSPFAVAPWRKLAALLAIVLLGLFATLQVAHVHTPGAVDDSHCAFCLAAHGVAAVAALPTPPALVLIQTHTPAPEALFPDTSPSISHFIRPPPATA
jgi:hypothetical protein